ncbi:MAG: PQQ-binding-like beta-propeller repeat protein [Anaerolineales bacterium]|jgi:outer membrane protein assembly factor BamB
MIFSSSSKLRRTLILLSFALLATLLSACGSRSVMQATSWPGVSIVENTAYIAFGQFVYSVDLDTGRSMWTFPREADRNTTFYAPPAISEDGETLVVGSYNQMVYGLNAQAATNEPLWTFEEPEDRIIGAPLIVGERVLVPTAIGRLYALDLTTGRPVWDEPFQAEHAIWSAPIVQDDQVFVGGLDHYVYSLSLETGRVNWSTDLGSAISDSPTLTDGLLLSGNFGGTLSALDVKTGRVQWQFQADDSIWGSPAVQDGVAYFGDVAGEAHAIDVETGQELWRQELSGPASASPVILDDRVYFVTEVGKMDALLLDSGTSAWPASATMVGRLLADPLLSSEGILVPAMESECLIFTVEPETGAVRCLFSTE